MLVSVYIRKADEELWRELPNKTEAISQLLRGQRLSGVRITEKAPPVTKKQKVPAKNLLNIPGVTNATEAKCLRHHVPFSVCESKH